MLFNLTACLHCNYNVTETSLKQQCSILKISVTAKRLKHRGVRTVRLLELPTVTGKQLCTKYLKADMFNRKNWNWACKE